MAEAEPDIVSLNPAAHAQDPEDVDPGEQTKLARTMGLGALIAYGVGDMLGTGIYALIGDAAGLMGNAVWLAFTVSMLAAILTGLSYACLSSRYPRAAGAAYVTQRAYRRNWLSYIVGLGVTASGLTSMAAASNAIAGYARDAGLALPTEVLACAVLILISLIVFRGIRESTWVNITCTLIEVTGLLIVIAVGMRYWGSVNYFEVPPAADGTPGRPGLLLVLNGAVLTFYSFVGFEDVFNVAEEVKNPRRNMPLGLLLALVVATLIYLAVSITAVSVAPYQELAASEAALVEVVRIAAPWFPPTLFTAIGVFAVANTALLNFVMGSRMLYGMADQGLLPSALGRVHPRRRTPHVAIGILLLLVLLLAVSGTVAQLATATALLLLGAFVIVNLALVVLKFRPEEPRGAFEVPFIIPALGALVCLIMIGTRLFGGEAGWTAPLIAGGMIAVIVVLYLILRPKRVVSEPVA